MLSRVKSLESHLLTRRCVACGYDGDFADHMAMCPVCRVDLTLRPPRSYAEMELLLGQQVTLDAPLVRGPDMRRLLYRWLLFVAMMLAGLLAIVYLLFLTIRI